MSRASVARKAAAYVAGTAGVSAACFLSGWGVLKGEAAIARRVVGQPFDGAPDDNGVYGAGPGDAIQFVVLGDSTAKGMGADAASQTVGAIIATAVAAFAGRPVRLTNVAVVGATSPDLGGQLDGLLARVPHPDVALIMVGANDVTSRLSQTDAVEHLAETVRRLRDADAPVVVGTCPDLGVIKPVPQPLRQLARRWSRHLAAAQTRTVVELGGRTVSLGDLLGHEFSDSPAVMFSKDRFHPSSAGYARAASALLPSILDAIGEVSADTGRRPERLRGEAVRPVASAARRAARDPGTEVTGTEVTGMARNARGPWAVLLRRHRHPLPAPDDAAKHAEPDETSETVAPETDTPDSEDKPAASG
ncbi:MAG TPA: SGNH/GDSL hydrolase family protein [Flexivirga sp.]|uniref:SGNH/GDSL hydrolase family protein n=1 Tax=Flexivirga sp. TaxID=1962927 RepID=UPI002CA13F21|nr:SGNH/GDSL hydrolase family protein [Flexivirga sp.]HWC24196.1 SGNH/GDSL hydrolase family protein [Flexivirga sp.]